MWHKKNFLHCCFQYDALLRRRSGWVNVAEWPQNIIQISLLRGPHSPRKKNVCWNFLLDLSWQRWNSGLHLSLNTLPNTYLKWVFQTYSSLLHYVLFRYQTWLSLYNLRVWTLQITTDDLIQAAQIEERGMLDRKERSPEMWKQVAINEAAMAVVAVNFPDLRNIEFVIIFTLLYFVTVCFVVVVLWYYSLVKYPYWVSNHVDVYPTSFHSVRFPIVPKYAFCF